ncbi:hypothetical protein D3C87_1650470 [compost metagenome]
MALFDLRGRYRVYHLRGFTFSHGGFCGAVGPSGQRAVLIRPADHDGGFLSKRGRVQRQRDRACQRTYRKM